MKTNEYIKSSFLSALGTFVYVSLIAWFGFNNPLKDKPDSFLMPVFALTLLIVSASITSFLVLGKPIQLFLAGDKRASIILFFSTLAWLVLFLLMVVVVLLVR